KGFLLIRVLVLVGIGIGAADRHPALLGAMLALVELQLLGPRQFEKDMSPLMREIELGLRDAVIGEVEKSGIGAGRTQAARHTLAFIERTIARIRREVDDRQLLRRAALGAQRFAPRAMV